MSKSTAEALARLLDQSKTQVLDNKGDQAENYKTRPENTQKKGYQSTPPNPDYAIVSPLTEVSRVEASFTVAAGGTVYVPTQITMTDANGTEFVFNFDMPTGG